MKQKTLRKSEIKELNEKIMQLYGIEPLSKKDTVVAKQVEKIGTIYEVNGDILFFEQEGYVIPTMKYLLTKQNILKTVTVDMGAVKFVVSGADIMRPGVVACQDEIEVNQIVAIIDENNKKPLAIGKAMFNAQELMGATSGKVVKSVHHVGDLLWQYLIA